MSLASKLTYLVIIALISKGERFCCSKRVAFWAHINYSDYILVSIWGILKANKIDFIAFDGSKLVIICNNNSRYCDLIRTLVHREYCMHNGSICSLKTSIQYVEDNFIPYLCDCVPSSLEKQRWIHSIQMCNCLNLNKIGKNQRR